MKCEICSSLAKLNLRSSADACGAFLCTCSSKNPQAIAPVKVAKVIDIATRKAA